LRWLAPQSMRHRRWTGLSWNRALGKIDERSFVVTKKSIPVKVAVQRMS
jgi:hypothetical protein